MRQIGKEEEEMPISPGPHSSVSEIFSSKKIFFLNSCSGSHRSEIPHIESEYCRRDEVSRRLFHHNSDLCDCDCASDGFVGCLRRNKQCFFKFFVLGLSIALILLLFGSLSYNLTRNKIAEESFEFEETKWVSHHHEYSNPEVKHVEANLTKTETEPVLDLPVPLYEHPDDYDTDEDLRRLQYHLDVNPVQGHDLIEPISVLPFSEQNANPQSEVLIIYDGREPPRIKRSISYRSKIKESDLREKHKRETESESNESFFEELNIVEGMEKFWEGYFKKGKTVFEPFSLTTPSHSTPMQNEEYSDEEQIEDELKSMFLSNPEIEIFNPGTSQEVSPNVNRVVVDTTETSTTLMETSESEISVVEEETESIPQTDISDQTTRVPSSDGKELIGDLEGLTSVTTEASIEDPRMDSLDGKNFRTWPLFHFSLPLSGLFGSNSQHRITADLPPSDTVRGISLADAKKIKKEKRKQLLLNSRVVGGSSDVRLPTGPDVSKPFVNAFETLKTNQQLSFTPSAASQFVLPYQMCLFAGPFSGPRPSGHGPQPRTFSLETPSLLPSIFAKPQPLGKTPYQIPTQQNFLSFSINNFPNAPPPRNPIQPSGGSFFNFPSQQPFSQFPAPNKQPIFCTYLQPPFFQFPTVPGTADFSHAKCVDCQGESEKNTNFAKETLFPSGRETLCSGDKISCMDGSSCIPVGFWCDNQVHCKDASDEAFCSCRERVSKDRLCDGYVDCPHGEDETGCFDCPKSTFSCESLVSPDSCIPLSKRCDGVRDCDTGADETDCSALFFHVRQNDSYQVSQVTGYLHRNWKGDWFPVCVEMSENTWAKEACLGELGIMPANVEVRFASVSKHYKGPFIVREEDGTVALQDHCKGHVSTFVSCPPMNCGTRVEFYNSRNSYLESEHEEEAIVKRKSDFKEKEEELSKGAENSRSKREETGRVVGGRESAPKAWPWAIAVYKNGAFHCGGVILDEKWVLTAAHCMEQYWKHYYEVRGGMLRRFSYSAMEQARTVSEVKIHENYDLSIMSNDLALLRLKEPFHFNRWVRPACLPVLQDGISKFSSGPAPGTRCTAVGWGALRERGTDPDQLREVEIPIMSRCKHKEDLVGEEICAGKLEGGKDTCQGDSGGPLLCRDSGTPSSWYIAGIVSHGEGCARPGEPGAYTRVSLFVDWITANTNDFPLPTLKPLQNCPGFRCQSGSRLCIPHKWFCNGFTDCLEAEDEKNCSDSAASSIFNRKYSTEDQIFGERDTKSKKVEGSIGSFDDQPPVKTDNPKVETSYEVNSEEFLGKSTFGIMLSDGLTEKPEPSPASVKTLPIEKIKSKEATVFSLSSESFTIKATEWDNDSEKHPTEGLPEGVLDKKKEIVEKDEGRKSDDENADKNEQFTTSEGFSTEAEKLVWLSKEVTHSLGAESREEFDNKESMELEINYTEKYVDVTNKEYIWEDEEKEELKVKENVSERTTAGKEEPTSTFYKRVTNSFKFETADERKSDFEKGETVYDVTDKAWETETEETNEDEDETVSEKYESFENLEKNTKESVTERTRDQIGWENEKMRKGPESEEVTTESMIKTEEQGSTFSWELTGTIENEKTEGYINEERTDSTVIEEESVDDDVKDDESEYENQVTEAKIEENTEGDKKILKEEEEESEELMHTEDTLSSKSIATVAFENSEEKSLTKGSEARKDISVEEETQQTTTERATSTEKITTVTQIHSVRTRETPETEITVEEYSTLSSSSSSDTNRLDSQPDYFQCRQIVQSVLPTYRCDGYEDCEDGTDEENCTCVQVLENSNPKLLCDDRPHCPDLADEKNCSKCYRNEFYCEKSKECVGLVERCDGMTDCALGEDEARCMSLGESPDRLATEGLVKINRKGVWRVRCQEEEPPLGAGDAIRICSDVGTVGYERYENRSLNQNCTGFYVSCAESLSRSVERYKARNGSYLWPWNGVLYSDGRAVCSGVLLRPRWVLASLDCLHNVSLSKNYLAAKFGSGTAIRIDGAHLLPESDAVLVHLSKDINETELVRPLGLPYVFESEPDKDLCVAVGDRTVFLKIMKKCSGNARCYKKMTATPSGCSSKPWVGVVVCQSRFGWYPSSVFSEKLGFCGFERVNFTRLQENLRDAMDKKVEVFPEPVCSGFRCPQGFCIPPSKICDGNPDCSGKEDETFGVCALKKQIEDCEITELKCGNGRCIPKILFGDGVRDCEDGSDEPSTATCVEYLRLTAPERICDGKRNCYDKTDENYDLCPCGVHSFRCKLSGFCVPKDFVCDGEKDCPEGEDEQHCMGRKIVQNSTNTHLEVMQKSYGIWHTMCPSHLSKERSDAFCKDLGFEKALFTYSRNQTVIVPQTEPFSWVKLNQRTSIGLRRNKPFVRLVTFKKTCHSVKCA